MKISFEWDTGLGRQGTLWPWEIEIICEALESDIGACSISMDIKSNPDKANVSAIDGWS